MTDHANNLLAIRDKFHSGMFGQREVWERQLEEAAEFIQAATPSEETMHLRNEIRAANAVLLRIDGMMSQMIAKGCTCCLKPPSTSS